MSAPAPEVDFIDCPACQGSGERWFNQSQIRDPQHDDSESCDVCMGEGSVTQAEYDAWMAENYEPPEVSYDDALARYCEMRGNYERECW